MKAKTLLLSSKAVFALVISAALITSCSKGDLDYKRRTTTPTTPTEPAPTPAPTPTPTPTPTGNYLSLAKSSARTISAQSNVVIENLQFANIDGNPLYINGSNNITIRN